MAKRLTLENFITRSKQVHGDKYSYEYVDISNGSHSKVKIVCPIHGIFEQTPSQHMVGNGCKKCAIDCSISCCVHSLIILTKKN